jgi:molybdopterin-guanine dinucleotide biosynthesis protein A
MIDDCTAIILAGGDSRRMGQDKATLRLGPRTLLAHVQAVVQPLFAELRVSVRQPRSDIDLPQICDAQPAAGPLAGLCAALAQVETAWLFAVATDMPFVQAALINTLAQRRAGFQAVVPVVHGHPQPLAAFYAKSGLAALRAQLASDGPHSLRAALARLNVCYVDASELLAADPDLCSFFDLDTPQDLQLAGQQSDNTTKEHVRGKFVGQ